MQGYLARQLKSSLILLYLILSLSQKGQGQSAVFVSEKKDEEKLKQLLNKYEALHKESLATFPVRYKKDYEEIAQVRWSGIKAFFNTGEIHTSVPAQSYLDALVKEIVTANPSLQKEAFQPYFSRSAVPNASYLGYGIIVFNMGLFRQLHNESQVAFILCHEIAHYFLKHSENRIKAYVTTLNSTEVQKELQQIKNAEFRKREHLDRLLKEMTFDSRRHSRDHEQEADSLALVWLKQTRFDAGEALSALSLLDTIDADTLDMHRSLQDLFNLKPYPFKKRWLAKESGLLGGHALIKEDPKLADSLKTHPDCSIRIALLRPQLSPVASGVIGKNVVDEAAFHTLRKQFDYEVIAHSFDSKNYTQSLYHTISLLQKQREDPYLITQIGKILNSFYALQKAHQLGHYIDLPAPHFPPSYNQLLQFVQNLYLEDYGAISHYYLQQFQSKLTAYAPYVQALQASQQISQ